MLVFWPYKATLGMEPHVTHQTLSLEAQITVVILMLVDQINNPKNGDPL